MVIWRENSLAISNMSVDNKQIMNEIIFLIEEAPEGGYTARALGHSIFTEGDTMQELQEMIPDAINCHFEENEKPKIIRLHYVKEEVLTL